MALIRKKSKCLQASHFSRKVLTLIMKKLSLHNNPHPAFSRIIRNGILKSKIVSVWTKLPAVSLGELTSTKRKISECNHLLV